MTMRRAGFAVLALVFVVGAVGCGQAAEKAADATASPSEKKSPSDDRASEAFPDEPKVDIDWQNTVVDVQPTSRFRDPQQGPDTAQVETTLALSEEPNDDTRKFLESFDGVETEFDGKLVRMTYSFDVEEVDVNRYQFEISAPVEFANLSKGDDVSVVVLLPREASEYDNVPTYGIERKGFTSATPEDDLEITEANEAPGRRITIGLYKRTDPKVGPIYVYIPGR
jgi:hypothetical protein